MDGFSKANPTQLAKEFTEAFGDLSGDGVKALQRKAWSGKTTLPEFRVFAWRLFWSLLDKDGDPVSWAAALEKQVKDYEEIKSAAYPKVDQVSIDPLSAFSDTENKDNEWDAFSKDLELNNFIRGDLERLYMNGVDDTYFEDPTRSAYIQSVLFVWAVRNKSISYRQGMHEIIAPIILCLELELDAWQSMDVSSMPNSEGMETLKACFRKDALEAHSYWLYEKVMADLQSLYDPQMITKGTDTAPAIVHFCTKVQDHFLRELDPSLCVHLEEAYVQAQLYGMRWSRLLFGREFDMPQVLRVWDYIFAACLDLSTASTGETPKKESLDEEDKDGVGGYLAALQLAKKQSFPPLLSILADMMIALLLQIRNDLIESDSSMTMMLLMRYPPLDDVTPILELTDMIRRGVLRRGAHIGNGEPRVRRGSRSRQNSMEGFVHPSVRKSSSDSASKKEAGTPSWLKVQESEPAKYDGSGSPEKMVTSPGVESETKGRISVDLTAGKSEDKEKAEKGSDVEASDSKKSGSDNKTPTDDPFDLGLKSSTRSFQAAASPPPSRAQNTVTSKEKSDLDELMGNGKGKDSTNGNRSTSPSNIFGSFTFLNNAPPINLFGGNTGASRGNGGTSRGPISAGVDFLFPEDAQRNRKKSAATSEGEASSSGRTRAISLKAVPSHTASIDAAEYDIDAEKGATGEEKAQKAEVAKRLVDLAEYLMQCAAPEFVETGTEGRDNVNLAAQICSRRLQVLSTVLNEHLSLSEYDDKFPMMASPSTVKLASGNGTKPSSANGAELGNVAELNRAELNDTSESIVPFADSPIKATTAHKSSLEEEEFLRSTVYVKGSLDTLLTQKESETRDSSSSKSSSSNSDFIGSIAKAPTSKPDGLFGSDGKKSQLFESLFDK